MLPLIFYFLVISSVYFSLFHKVQNRKICHECIQGKICLTFNDCHEFTIWVILGCNALSEQPFYIQENQQLKYPQWYVLKTKFEKFIVEDIITNETMYSRNLSLDLNRVLIKRDSWESKSNFLQLSGCWNDMEELIWENKCNLFTVNMLVKRSGGARIRENIQCFTISMLLKQSASTSDVIFWGRHLLVCQCYIISSLIVTLSNFRISKKKKIFISLTTGLNYMM